MGDLVAPDNINLIDKDEESFPGCDEVDPYPSTSYGILSVKESKDVHVGDKYVAEKIVIVLPETDHGNRKQIQRRVLPILNNLNCPRSFDNCSRPTRYYQYICVSVMFLTLNVVILSGVYLTSWSPGATTTELPIILNNQVSGSNTLPSSATSISKFNNQTTTRLFSNTKDHLPLTFSRSGAIKSTIEIQSVNIHDKAVSVSERYTDSTRHYEPPCENLDPKDFLAVKYAKAINVTKWSDKVCFVHSWEWGSRSCPYYLCQEFAEVISHVYIHYIDRCGSFQTCSSLVRKSQRDFYEKDVTLTNFMYNFVIGGDNRIYEVLGWNYLIKGGSPKWIHIGIQLWDGQPTNTSDVSVKQMYNMMLLITVGRWCEKLRFNFEIKFICEPACSRNNKLYRESMIAIKLMKLDEYYLYNEALFTEDSKRLGLQFMSCNGMVFTHFRVCQIYPCKLD